MNKPKGVDICSYLMSGTIVLQEINCRIKLRLRVIVMRRSICLNITKIFVKCSFHATDHKYKDKIFNRNSILSATSISYLFYGKSVIVFAS